MPDEKNTAQAGAGPADDQGQKSAPPTDKQGAISDPPTDKDLLGQDGKPLPFDQHPKWKAAREAEKTLNKLLEANGLDDVDDLMELVESGKAVKGKLPDPDQLDDLIAKADKLERYEAYWREQEERQQREYEAPNETIARLEQQLKAQREQDGRKEATRQEQARAAQAISAFEKEVATAVDAIEDIPKEQRSFFKMFLGVDNPAVEIDITDRKAIKKMVQDGIKMKAAYDQAVIDAYIKGKDSIPRSGGGGSGDATIDNNKPKIMLKDARQAMKESLSKMFGG